VRQCWILALGGLDAATLGSRHSAPHDLIFDDGDVFAGGEGVDSGGSVAARGAEGPGAVPWSKDLEPGLKAG
jgi:hypothetical protein